MNIEDLLIDEEGHKLTVYLDSLGNPTVGTGHLVVPADNLKVGDKITEERAEEFFVQDLASASAPLAANVSSWPVLNDVRQAVLISMCFNMGWHGLSAFKNTLALINNQLYADAANAMLASKWAKQVPHRAEQLADMMETGEWSA